MRIGSSGIGDWEMPSGRDLGGRNVVVGVAAPEVLANLGFGVLDDAMVEAAAYVLKRKEETHHASGTG